MGYYSALESKEILTYIAIWTDTEHIMLSKISQKGQMLCGITYMSHLE
jgi:hypothetical protein